MYLNRLLNVWDYKRDFSKEGKRGGVILCAFDLEIMKIILGIGNPKFLMKL